MFLLAVAITMFNHTWIHRPDLSYKTPAVPSAYTKIDLFYLKPGTEAEAETLSKQHAEIDRQAGVEHAREMYVAADAPMVMQIVRAASRGEYERERNIAEAKRGERIRSVYAADSKIIERIVTIEEIALPGAKGLVTLDYIAFDRATNRLWVPAGNTKSVDVIDDAGVRRIGGFATREFTLKGRRGFLGPSSVAIGKGSVFIGNRADRTICRIDARDLERRRCVSVAGAAGGWAAAPDAVVFVPATNEIWITRGAPPLGIASADRAITIFDADLKMKGKIPLDGSAEGYAVDAERGVFYTNIEESAETIAIDVRKRAVLSRWKSGCDEPHGIALDAARQFLFVACSDRVISADARDGKTLDSIATGDGLDNIDFYAGKLYAAASIAATLTIAAVGDDGKFLRAVTVPTVKGARVVVAGPRHSAYVADPLRGKILRIE
jgi:DNA-binding beta-propeller fold protein YncE